MDSDDVEDFKAKFASAVAAVDMKNYAMACGAHNEFLVLHEDGRTLTCPVVDCDLTIIAKEVTQ